MDNTPGVSITFGSQSSTGSWLLDTGAAASIISEEQAANLHVRYRPGTEDTDNPQLETFNPANPGAPGQLVPDQFSLTIGGIGGTSEKAGFFLDSLLVRTIEGNAANDDDPNHLRYQGAAVLVGDITLQDPQTQQTLTLDGIFGMNMLVGSAWFDPETFEFLGLADGYFNWLAFDEPNGVLGLDVKDIISLPPNEWGRSSGGSWDNVANWSHGEVPNGTDVSAMLGPAITSNATVDLQATSPTLRGLRFNHAVRAYNLASSGGGTLIFEASSGPATLSYDTANSVSHEISAPIRIKSNLDFHGLYGDLRLTLSGGQTWDPGRTLSVRSGVLHYNLDNTDSVVVGGGNALVIDDGAKVTLAGTRSPLAGSSDHVDVINNSIDGFEIAAGNHAAGFIAGIGSTSVVAGASLSVEGIQQSQLTLNGGSQLTVRNNAANAGISVLGTLSIAGGATPTAKLDLTNNAAVIDYTGASPVATVRAQILSGRGGAGLAAPGTAKASRAARGRRRTRLTPSRARSATPRTPPCRSGRTRRFRGQPVDDTSFLMAYTRTGDANLDGMVNDDDVTIVGATIAPGSSQSRTGHWATLTTTASSMTTM